ncbi:MAG TPA: RidA family protein [Sphingomicrobium sp.]|nr:RidA family protein [Sphingomicrobium sp.]
MRALYFVAAGAIAVSTAAPAKERLPVQRIGEPSINGQRLPFSTAVQVGDMLYLSGQIGNRPDGTLPEGIEAQSRQVMDNIGAVLKSADLGFGDVVKCTVMIDDIKQWGDFNKVYVTYFPDGRFPARSAFGADGLAMGALVEVECWAYAGHK